MRDILELFRLPFKALVSVEEQVSVEYPPLRSTPGGGEDTHPQMLFVLGS